MSELKLYSRLFVIFLFVVFSCQAQNIRPFGGYIFMSRDVYPSLTYHAAVFFKNGDFIPDSMNLGVSKRINRPIDYIEELNNGFVKVIYSGSEILAPPPNSPVPILGVFSDTVFLIGKNTNNKIKFRLYGLVDFSSYRQGANTALLIDKPVIRLQKDRDCSINFIQDIFEDDSLTIAYNGIHYLPGITANVYTKDIHISSNELDTGLFSFGIFLNEYIKNPGVPEFQTFAYFTVEITNELIPILENATPMKRDYLGIPYKTINPKDSIVKLIYQFYNFNKNDSVSFSAYTYGCMVSQIYVNPNRIFDSLYNVEVTVKSDQFCKYPQSVGLKAINYHLNGTITDTYTSFYLSPEIIPEGYTENFVENFMPIIYPNPVGNGPINVAFRDSRSRTLIITDSYGRTVSNFSIEVKSFELIKNNFDSGLYYLIVIDNSTGNKYSSKIVIL